MEYENFYQKFVRNFLGICTLITNTLEGNQFEWTDGCNKSFERKKEAMASAPILVPYNPNLKTIEKTNVSDYAVAGVLFKSRIMRIKHFSQLPFILGK